MFPQRQTLIKCILIISTKESVYSHRTGLGTNMAAVLLFRRETNMAAVKSREQDLYTRPLSSLTSSRALLLWWNGTINDPVSHL